MILLWNDTADDDDLLFGSLLVKKLTQLWYQGAVGSGLGRDADDMNVVLNRLLGGLLRGLEHRPDVDVKA